MNIKNIAIIAVALISFSSCSKTYICDSKIETSEPYPQVVEVSTEIKMTKEEANQYEEDNTYSNTFSWPEEYTETVTTECK